MVTVELPRFEGALMSGSLVYRKNTDPPFFRHELSNTVIRRETGAYILVSEPRTL